MLLQQLRHANAPHGVAHDVQPGAPNADAEHARNDKEDVPADPALGREADGASPLPREVIHPTSAEDGQRLLRLRCKCILRSQVLLGKVAEASSTYANNICQLLARAGLWKDAPKWHGKCSKSTPRSN